VALREIDADGRRRLSITVAPVPARSAVDRSRAARSTAWSR
jgi:hypothetical protein